MHYRAFARLLLAGAWLAAIGLASAPARAQESTPPAPRVLTDLVYRTVGDLSLTLDAYLPSTPGPHPAVLVIHGGAWIGGDKGDMAPFGRGLASNGLAAFSVNYRLSGQAPYPAQIEDCLEAVKWLRAHAVEYEVDPDRLGALGASAGAHLALLVATMEPPEDLTDAAGQPLRNWVRAVVSVAGPTDLTAGDWDQVTPELRQVLAQFLGGTPQEVPDNYAQASPVTHISPDDPPVLLIHGDRDQIVPYAQALIMQQKLQEAGVSVELITLHGGGHGAEGTNAVEFVGALVRTMEFLEENLTAAEAPPASPPAVML